MQGYSLQAAVRRGADERQVLEQLCRYITRPALTDQPAQCNAAVQLVRKLKTAWRDGTMHRVMSPLEFMRELASSGAEATVAPDPVPQRDAPNDVSFAAGNSMA